MICVVEKTVPVEAIHLLVLPVDDPQTHYRLQYVKILQKFKLCIDMPNRYHMVSELGVEQC